MAVVEDLLRRDPPHPLSDVAGKSFGNVREDRGPVTSVYRHRRSEQSRLIGYTLLTVGDGQGGV